MYKKKLNLLLDLLMILWVALLLNIMKFFIYKNHSFGFLYDLNYFIKSYIDVILICIYGWIFGYFVIFLTNLDKYIINRNIGFFLKVNFSIIFLLAEKMIINFWASVQINFIKNSVYEKKYFYNDCLVYCIFIYIFIVSPNKYY